MEADAESYWTFRRWIDAAVHELPAGVLWGTDAATPAECAELLAGLEEFATFCEQLGLSSHTDYIESCRWHFERYPHYVGRIRHLENYELYVRARRGPRRIQLPPRPRWAEAGRRRD